MINIIQKEIDNLSMVRTKFVQEIEDKQTALAKITKEYNETISKLDKSVKNIDKSIASLYATVTDLETDMSEISEVPSVDVPETISETEHESQTLYNQEYTDNVSEEIEEPEIEETYNEEPEINESEIEEPEIEFNINFVKEELKNIGVKQYYLTNYTLEEIFDIMEAATFTKLVNNISSKLNMDIMDVRRHLRELSEND